MGVREAVLIGMVLAGTWAVAGAEVLGLGAAFRFGPVLAWWLVPLVPMLALVVARRGGPRGCVVRPARPDPVTLVLLALAASLLLITGYVAATCPTNTWDCWTYHLPRQVYWIQQHSVDHFPAHDRRQLEMPPMAEFLSAQWMILSGGDRWSNMHQWFALLGSAVAASLVARELGSGGRGQALAAVLAVSVPAAASQATNGKNDVVVALWALTLAYLAARTWRERACPWGRAVLIGAALGLVMLTKGTGYLAAAPICVAIAAAMLRSNWRRALAQGVAIGIIALSLNAGHWARNQEQFGSPLGLPQSRGGYPLVNTTVSPAAVVSSVVRNVSMHAVTPSTRVNGWMQAGIERLHELIGIDPSDPRITTRPLGQPFALVNTAFSDGNNPAPVHLLLAAAVIGAAALRPRLIGGAAQWAALALPLVAFILFCAYLRWQPWHLRLHIPFVMLLAPGLAVAVERAGRTRAGAAVPVAAAAAAVAWTNLLWQVNRPLVGRDSVLTAPADLVFYQQARGIREPLQEAAERAVSRRPSTVGLTLRHTQFEYPVLREVLRRSGDAPPRLVTLNPNFGPRDANPAEPEVLITATTEHLPVQQLSTGMVYMPAASSAPFGVYVPASAVRRALAALSVGVPPFHGWTEVSGLHDEEPHEGPGVVRWGLAPRTVLEFQSDGEPAELILEARRGGREDQTLRVRLNGEDVLRFRFGRVQRFVPLRASLRPRAGRNVLELEYALEPDLGPGKNRRAVVYERLQVVGRAGRGEK